MQYPIFPALWRFTWKCKQDGAVCTLVWASPHWFVSAELCPGCLSIPTMCPAGKEYAESRTSPHTHAGITEMFTKGGLLLVITPKLLSVNASSEWPSDSFTAVECSVSPSPWLPYGNASAFLLGRTFYFYIKYFSLFWRASFRDESTCTLPQEL